MLQVTCFEHIDYGGVSKAFGPGTYRADHGALAPLPNDSLSSLKVPLGLGVDAYQHENGGNGAGKHVYFGPGDHRFVGDDFNDECSLIIIRDVSSFYISSREFPSCPDFPLSSCSTGEKFSRSFAVPVPNGYRVEWWGATKAGDASWSASIENGIFRVLITVSRMGAFSSANWVGVNARCVPA